MFRYADPLACPGCRAPIEYAAPRCHHCDLVLTGQPGERLYRLLATADASIAEMRVQQAAPSTLRVPQTVPAGPPTPTTEGLPPAPPLPPRYEQPGGLSAASVPRILLSVGALCLVVAAMVFLAVAWASLGVEGRTGVLVVLTAAAAGTAAWLAGRELRGGAESFTAVALALVVLDVTGADRAGWLGTLSMPGLLVAIGVTLTPIGLAAALAARRTPIRLLASAESAAALGALVGGLGLASHVGLSAEPGVVLAMLATAALAGFSAASGLRVAASALAALAALWWAVLVALGLTRLSEPTFAAVWDGLQVWPLLVAIAAAAAAATVQELDRALRVLAASAAVALAALVLCVVAVDESATTIALVELAVVAVAGIASARLNRPWRWVVAAPVTVAGLGLATSALQLYALATEALLVLTVWQEDVTAPLFTEELPWSWPLLLPAGVVGAAVAAWLLARCLVDEPTRGAPWWLAALLLFSVAHVPVLYGVPLWAELLVLVAVALAAAGSAAYVRRVEPAVAAGALLLVAFVACFGDEWTTAISLGLVTAAGLAGTLRARGAAADLSGIVFLAAMGGFLWTVQHLADIDPVWRAVPVVVIAGLFALARPGQAGELPAGVVATFAVAAAVITPTGFEQGWLAAYLTLAGVLVAASALVHGDRRELGWAAGVLFTFAQWLRLEQLGVDTVEAYTLPLALVLLAVGLVSLRRAEQSTARALGTGLSLALVPTLLQVLVDPLSDRALMLGGACLLLVLAGVWLRWSAPLVAGALVGALIVLRQAAEAELPPQWVVIGTVGLTLTLLGVTWEQRLAEIRRAAGYLRSLR